ncbi:PVC-type heme-binding CxxCH protein [Planctomyces sp. SH-PL14]|uniref:PVC-type heme-binding CxxCH protein n=1 Tax=Planctomyces sp. SH-PL14 TaxID=1632864 RepID=UPI00078B4399|nr:PVC-type heme-binding CxxCH protein [Planctomyces sp. SH-PL14]AMV20366.1 Cytochrome c [Planctomyces sp. SH-PL14]
MRFPALLLMIAVVSACAAAAAADDFPQPFNTLDDAKAAATPPEEAVKRLRLPEGFRATLFAAEPDVQNPIGMTWDARGRLWIAENYTYADGQTRFDLGLRDRVLIFEDTNGDGRFDSRKVFVDNLQILTSVEVGHGGVWVMCPPRLMFIPDADRDDVPDGPPQTVLDGFNVFSESYHNFANGLRFGPDGWLYGRCGGSCPGEIGPPGTPDARRVPLRGGMWRYHPIRKTYETLCTGTTNPWGHDWDALGELFYTNTVTGHLFYNVVGGHFLRNGTLDPNPRVYDLMSHHADHFHYDTGKGWQNSRDGAANDLGGGHAHSGAMIYLGDNWPAEHRGLLYTINLHGRRVNTERLERHGGGFVGRHAKDFLLSDDPWYRALDLSYGPDGGVYIIDWSDTGECHERNGVHRTSGRIYKIVYGSPKAPAAFDLHRLSDTDLVALHGSPNEWYVRQARLILAERRAATQPLADAATELMRTVARSEDRVLRMRSFLTLFNIGALDAPFLGECLAHTDEAIRTQAVRMLTDPFPLDGPLGPVPYDPGATATISHAAEAVAPLLTRVAQTDPSGLVRLTLASTLQRLPVGLRAPLAQALVSHPEDRDDHDLPLLVWYGLIPVADVDPAALVPVAKACQWPTTRTFIARRLAEEIDRTPAPLSELLTFAATQSEDYRRDIVTGLSDGLRGWRKAKMPASWKTILPLLETSSDEKLVAMARDLNVLFGDGRALDEVKRIALDKAAPMAARQAAVATLIESRPPDLRDICQQLVGERVINVSAAKGLALFDDPKIGEQLVKAYRGFRAPERPQIMSILVSRAAFARPLLEAIAEGKIPREDLTSFHVRQIHSLGDSALSARTTEVWGQLRDSSAEKRALMAELKGRLSDEVLAKADLSNGRLVFRNTCLKCHKLYGEGQTIGPDLTGSNRSNLDYILENVIDPSAVVNKDFRMTIVVLVDGRVLNGVITQQTEKTITLQTLTEKVTIDKTDIEESRPTDLSPMPEGQLQTLTADQIRDLVAYLRHHSQVALPPGAAAEVK